MLPSSQRSPAKPAVLLVSMPWTTLIEPCLGLGILKAVLEREQIACQVLHANLFMLQHLRAETYEALSISFALNDYLFSAALDPVVTHVQQRWLRQKVQLLLSDGAIDHHRFGGPDGVVKTLLRLRNEIVPGWLEEWADEIAAHQATLVGFTCMFDQTIASLTLAKMVRERAPEKMLVLGGVAVRTPTAQMILRSSPWIDAICDGEGEITVVELARASAGEMALDQVHGIVLRSATGEPISTPPPGQIELDTIPAPNYDDYFADLRRLSAEYAVDVEPPNLPIENSRGCWWGAKSHCVFCGIRHEDMAYRARSAAKVLDHMAELSQRYRIDGFRFSDYIFPHRYFETLLPDLVRIGSPYRLSSEAKANLSKERIELLAKSGFHELQLGIESFSSDVLRKMRKGVTAAQNVFSLVLCRQLGVRVLYNLLYGFPDDDLVEYERMAAQLPNLIHLHSPVTCVPVQITRFAPLHMNPAHFGIDEADPEPCYDLIFSREYLERTGFDLRDFCYYFDRPFENGSSLQRIYDNLDRMCARWRTAFAKGAAWLYFEQVEDDLVIHDQRLETEKVYTLGRSQSTILLQSTHPTSLRCLQEDNPSLRDVEDIVAELEERGLLFRDETRLISLVLAGRPARLACQSADDAARSQVTSAV